MRPRIVLVAALVALLGLLWWLGHPHTPGATQPAGPPAGSELIAGGDGGGLPRATLLEEHIDPAGVDRAVEDAADAQLRAVVILRDGHVVYERYGQTVTGNSVVDGGGFARTLLAVLAGIATGEGIVTVPPTAGFDPAALRAAIESGSHQGYAAYLSHRLWSRLNAGAAWVDHAPGAVVPADCCVHARVLDWMRLAALLADGGRFEGKQLVPADWLQRMQRPLSPDSLEGFGIELGAAARGSEPLASRAGFLLRGPQRWRIWVVPPLHLAVLYGSDAPAVTDAGKAWDETRLPNAVIRAVTDRPPEPGDMSQLQRLVPAH